MQSDYIESCLRGEQLYGDNFNSQEIDEWFADEAEGYAMLGASDTKDYRYQYHELNKHHGFRFLDSKIFDHALGMGSAYGDEFLPIKNSTKRITILDPSDAFSPTSALNHIPCDYKKPSPSGDMPFDDNSFDLITCFGVLHHIPNVSHVIAESYRVLAADGTLLLREPVVSMGDWRKPRKGLTRRERGIPVHWLDRVLDETGFQCQKKHLCMWPPLAILAAKAGISPFGNPITTRLDAVLSTLTRFNAGYHRTHIISKFAPVSAFYVLGK